MAILGGFNCLSTRLCLFVRLPFLLATPGTVLTHIGPSRDSGKERRGQQSWWVWGGYGLREHARARVSDLIRLDPARGGMPPCSSSW